MYIYTLIEMNTYTKILRLNKNLNSGESLEYFHGP